MLGTQCYLDIDLWRMVGVKALSGSERDACLSKESQGWDWASIFPMRRQALCFVSCKMICRCNPMQHVEFEWTWKGLKSPVLSCRRQEIQEVRNVLDTWCHAIGSDVSFLSFLRQHLSTYVWKDLDKRPTILGGISWGMPARGSQSFEAAWRFRRRRRGQDASSLGSTAVGLDMLKDLRQVFWNLNNAITLNYCNWMQLVQLSMIA